MSELVDVHFHLDYYKNHKELYYQVNKLKQYTLCVTNTPEVFESCIDMYKETKYLKFALGYNPQMIKEYKFSKYNFAKNIKRTKYIGEVGLDYSKKFVDYKKEQIDIFNYICEAASHRSKILSVHSRGAANDVFKIMKDRRVKDAIIHWYTGDIDILKKFIREGYYFSVNPSMLGTRKGVEIIKNIPVNRILIESDGPFGKLENKIISPSKIKEVYNKIKIIVDIEGEFEEIVYNNLKNLLYRNINRNY